MEASWNPKVCDNTIAVILLLAGIHPEQRAGPVHEFVRRERPHAGVRDQLRRHA
jgi:hypothetical protein